MNGSSVPPQANAGVLVTQISSSRCSVTYACFYEKHILKLEQYKVE